MLDDVEGGNSSAKPNQVRPGKVWVRLWIWVRVGVKLKEGAAHVVIARDIYNRFNRNRTFMTVVTVVWSLL